MADRNGSMEADPSGGILTIELSTEGGVYRRIKNSAVEATGGEAKINREEVTMISCAQMRKPQSGQ